MPLRHALLLFLASLLAFGCGVADEEKIVFDKKAPRLGESVALTLTGPELPDGALARFFAGDPGPGEVTVERVEGIEVSVPLGDALELGAAAVAGGRARLETAVPFLSRFSGHAFSVVALLTLPDGTRRFVGPASTSNSVKPFLAVGPKQPFLGESLTLAAAAAPRAKDAELRVYVGEPDAGEGVSTVTVAGGLVELPLTGARLVAARPFASGAATVDFAMTPEAQPEGSRVPFAAVVIEDGAASLVHVARSKPVDDVLITDPVAVLAVLLAILGALFWLNAHPILGRIFKVLPLLVFCYFTPTLFSNTGLIPIESPLYGFIKTWMLPASLILLTLSVDIPAIARLGRQAVGLFLIATLTIVLGGPIALFLLHGLIPESLGIEEAWKGLAALSGSWIGGTANMVAIGESVGVSDSTFQLMIVVDVAVANVWMAALLFFAGRDEKMDAKIGADRRAIDECRRSVETFQAEVSRPTNLPDLLTILAIAIGGTVVATFASRALPQIGDIIRGFTWVVVIVTAIGVVLSFTRLRHLEGAGASKVGSVFLYLLVASIGAHAEFAKVVDAPALVAIGAVWMLFHAIFLLLARRFLKAPIFFAAVGSKANIGGAASAPIVAAAFHPALAPVGILLAVGGYVVGTYAGLLCAFLLDLVASFVG